MGRGGQRAPRPELKIVTGERADRINRAAPKFKKASLKRPEHLVRPDAVDYWTRHAAGLIEADLLKDQDVDAFVILGEFWATFAETTRTLAEEGMTAPSTSPRSTVAIKQHPALLIPREAGSQYLKFAREFGLTLSARNDVKVPDGSKDGKDHEDFW